MTKSKGAETRSEDYLQAKVEGILERRAGAQQRPNQPGTKTPIAFDTGGGVLNMINQRRAKTLAASK